MARVTPLLYALLGLSIGGVAFTDEDDEAPAPAAVNTAQPELSAEQQQAVGIALVHPLKASAATPIEASHPGHRGFGASLTLGWGGRRSTTGR